MKSPPIQYTDGEARDLVEAFIRDETIELKRLAQTNGMLSGNGHTNGHVILSEENAGY
jgi:hypothetical protein